MFKIAAVFGRSLRELDLIWAIGKNGAMRAYQILSDTGLDGLKQVDLPEPTLKPDQVRVRVRAVSLNYRDHLIVSGNYRSGGKLPLIPLSDGAGEVLEVGENVTEWKVGDRVAGCFFQNWEGGSYLSTVGESALGGAIDGMFAEQVVLHERGLVAVPDHLNYEEAATLPCAALTAWHALVTKGRVNADETVLLLGTGGVSVFGLLFAKMHGARAIITSSSDEKLERAKQLGADHCINYRSHPDWEKEVLKVTDGEGVHHALEVGGQDTFPKTLQSLGPNGRMSIIGGVSGFSGAFDFGEMIARMGVIQGIFVGSREMFAAMNRAISRNKLKPWVDRVFPFEEAAEAYRHLESGAHFGKIVIALP